MARWGAAIESEGYFDHVNNFCDRIFDFFTYRDRRSVPLFRSSNKHTANYFDVSTAFLKIPEN